MTLTIDPVTISILVTLLLAVIGAVVWLGRLGQRVDRLETDVAELKAGQAQILGLLHQHIGYHQGIDAGTD